MGVFSVSKGRYPISPFKYRREIGLVLKAAAGSDETDRVVRIFKHAFGFSKPEVQDKILNGKLEGLLKEPVQVSAVNPHIAGNITDL